MEFESAVSTPVVVLVALVVALVLLPLLIRWLRTPSQSRASRTAVPGVPREIERVFTTHVTERMAQRGVTRERVEQTLSAPTTVTHDPVERSYRFEKGFAGEMVKVWVAAEPWPPVGQVIIKSTAAQRFAVVRVPRSQIGRLIGPGGSTVTALRKQSGARIDVADNGTVTITADTRDAVQHAERAVRHYRRT